MCAKNTIHRQQTPLSMKHMSNSTNQMNSPNLKPKQEKHEYMKENCTGQNGPIKQGKLHRVPEHFITEVGAHLMKPSVMVITCK